MRPSTTPGWVMHSHNMLHRCLLLLALALCAPACRDKDPVDDDDGDVVEDTGEDPPTAAEQAWIDACGATCAKLYDPFECNIQRAGSTQEEMVATCEGICIGLYGVDGDLGDYWPYEFKDAGESVELENEEQAQEWMDCIADTECVPLEDGYCAPVW